MTASWSDGANTDRTTPAIGIDLGTTFTAAAAYRDGRAEPLTLGTSGWSIPSVLHLSETGEVICGEPAEYLGTSAPARTISEFKRHFGSEVPFVTPAGERTPDWCMTELLRHVLRVVSTYDATPDRVVITHPANWGEHRLELLERCATDAGLSDVALLSEPVAAAVHYAELGRIASGETVAIYDFGGGTFDATVLQHGGSSIDIVGVPQGADDVGGIDLDQIVIGMVDDATGGKVSDASVTDPDVVSDLYTLAAECRRCKITLSSDHQSPVRVRIGASPIEATIRRDDFEHRIRPLIERTIDVLGAAVASAGLAFTDLDRVLLVGGSARIPLVAQLVSDAVGVPVSVDVDAASAIAQGAALYGGGDALATVRDQPQLTGDVVSPHTHVEHELVEPGASVGAPDPSTLMVTVVGGTGGDFAAHPPGPHSIGRSATCDIVVPDSVVSRTHATLVHEDGLWTYIDSSANGSFIDGHRQQTVAVVVDTSIRLGHEGPELRLSPQQSATVLSVEAGGQIVYPAPSRTYIIGRRAPADIVVADPQMYVSGSHLELHHDEDGWKIRDVSTNGTFFADGRRLDASFHLLDGSLTVHLGVPDGPEVAFAWSTPSI